VNADELLALLLGEVGREDAVVNALAPQELAGGARGAFLLARGRGGGGGGRGLALVAHCPLTAVTQTRISK
jgi:hypothetical protein